MEDKNTKKNVSDEQLDAVMKKLHKLFAMKEGNGCTEEEAKSAAALAQRILLQYGLTQEEVEVAAELGKAEKEQQQQPTEQDLGWRCQHWILQLAMVVAKHFRCRVVMTRRKAPSWMEEEQKAYANTRFFGMPVDAKVAAATFWLLHDAAEELGKKYTNDRQKEFKKRQKSAAYVFDDETFSWNKTWMSYCMGFVRGVDEALTVQETTYALVVVENKLVTDYANKHFRNRTVNTPGVSDFDAHRTGKADGNAMVKSSEFNRS